jgi:hypothetical protein
MPQVLYQGPRDELRWNGIAFKRGMITPVESGKDARRLAAFDGFVIIPEASDEPRKGGWPKGKPRKATA